MPPPRQESKWGERNAFCNEGSMGGGFDWAALWVNSGDPLVRNRRRSSWCQATEPAAPQGAPVLTNVDARTLEERRRAQEKPSPWGHDRIGHGIRRDPRERCQAGDMYSCGPIPLAKPCRNAGHRCMAAA